MKPTLLLSKGIMIVLFFSLFLGIFNPILGQNDCPASGITFSNVLSPSGIRGNNNDIGYAGFEKNNGTYTILANTDLINSSPVPSIQLTDVQSTGTVSTTQLWDHQMADYPKHAVSVDCASNRDNYLVVGHTGITGQETFFLTEITPSVPTVPSHLYPAERQSIGRHITLTANRNHYAAVGNWEHYIFAVLGNPCEHNPNGFYYFLEEDLPAEAHSVIEVSDLGGFSGPSPYYAITGQINEQLFLMIINSSGGIEYNGIGHYPIAGYSSIGLDIVEAPDKTITITGKYDKIGNNEANIFLLNIDPDPSTPTPLGNINWIYNYDIPNSDNETPHSLLVREDGHYIIAGKDDELPVSTPCCIDQGNAFLMEIVPDGSNIVWAKEYQEQEGASFEDLRLTMDGGYFCSGYTFYNDQSTAFYDVYAVKTDSNGRIGSCECYEEIETGILPINTDFKRIRADLLDTPKEEKNLSVIKELDTEEKPCYIYNCPPITCQMDTCLTLESGQTSIAVEYPPVSLACPSLSITYNPPSGSEFFIGTTTVTCTATNEVTGEIDSCTFDVIISSSEGCAPGNFAKLIGDSLDNHFTEVKFFNNAFYAVGNTGTSPNIYGTFSKISRNGVLEWTIVLDTLSNLFDFEQLDNDEFLLVGRSEPVRIGNTWQDNKSLLARVQDVGNQGNLIWRQLIDVDPRGREAFYKIIKSPVVSAFPYYLAGLINNSPNPSSYDELVILNMDENGNINRSNRYTTSGTTDHEIIQDIVALPNGGIIMVGAYNISSRSSALIINQDCTLNQALNFNNNTIIGGIHPIQGSTDYILIGMTTNFTQGFITRVDAQLQSIGTGLVFNNQTRLTKITEDAFGNYYAIGLTIINGQNRAVVNKFTVSSAGVINLIWTKYLEDGTSDGFGRGTITGTDNELFYTDCRRNNLNSFGRYDILIASVDTSFNSCNLNEDFNNSTANFNLTTTIDNRFSVSGIAVPPPSVSTIYNALNYQEAIICCEKDIEDEDCCKDEEAFRARIAQGFDYSVDSDSCKLVIEPLELTPCYDVYWSWGDGTTNDASLAWNEPICHYYTQAGVYQICMVLVERDSSGNICWEDKVCREVEVECSDDCCKDEDAFRTRVATAFDFIIDPDSCQLKVIPLGLDSCDQVAYYWGDSTKNGFLSWDEAICHPYDTAGIYQLRIEVVELDANGVVCWRENIYKEIKIDCCECNEEESEILLEEVHRNFLRLMNEEECIYTVSIPELDSCKSMYIDWGEGLGFQAIPVATDIPHTYSSNGTYPVCLQIRMPNDSVCYELCKAVEVNCNSCCKDEDEFFDRVADGFDLEIDADSCKITVIPKTLDTCYQVYWTWENGLTEGPFSWNQPACHYYDTSGIFDICMQVKELNGDSVCWVDDYCAKIELDCDPPPCVEIICDTVTCNPDDSLSYEYCFKVINNSDSVATNLLMYNLPSGYYFYGIYPSISVPLMPALSPGDTSEIICIEISAPNIILSSEEICLNYGLLSANNNLCCHSDEKANLTLKPCCNTCDEDEVETILKDVCDNYLKLIDNEQCIYSISIPPIDSCYNLFVDWGEGDGYQPVPLDTNLTHTYDTNGIYVVCLAIRLPDGTVCEKICKEITVDCCRCDKEQAAILLQEVCHNLLQLANEQQCTYFISNPPIDSCYNLFVDWGVGGGYQPVPLDTSVMQTYDTNGIYVVCLEIRLPDGTVCEKVCKEIIVDCCRCDKEQAGILLEEVCYNFLRLSDEEQCIYTVSIPELDSCYNFFVDWGEGGGYEPVLVDTSIMHTYDTNGTYNVCLQISMLDGTLCEELCKDLVVDCCGCNKTEIVVEPIIVNDDSCCAKIDLLNNCSDSAFTRIETEVLTPGVVFGFLALGGPNIADWNIDTTSTNTLVSWLPNSGFIPTGTTNDIIQFCLDDINHPSERPQKVVLRWYGNTPQGEAVLCIDTLMFDCKREIECIEVCEQEIICDSTNSKYIYNFKIKNRSTIPFNATDVVVNILSPSGLYFSFPPGNVFNLGSLATGDTAMISACIESTGTFPSSASEIILSYQLKYAYGNRTDTCCFENVLDTLTLPKCGIQALCAYQDSLSLVDLYNSTNGENWTNQWDLNQPMRTWYGVQVNEAGCVTSIHLENNQLEGTLPTSLGNLSNLSGLIVGRNKITGTIPKELGNLSNLTYLLLNENNLSGAIPKELGNLSNLVDLWLQINELSGAIPKKIGQLSKLVSFLGAENQLADALPKELGNLETLESLMLSSNQISGTIPIELGTLNNLKTLWLNDNQLTGFIPNELGNLTNLESLILSINQLSGTIPKELAQLSKLSILNLRWNQLTGNIPVELGNTTNLTVLQLGSNQLTGSIPAELGGLANLEIFELNNNQLIGAIPNEFGTITTLNSFRLSNNQLTGEIPAELGNLSNLSFIKLNDNQLSGCFPTPLLALCNVFEKNFSGNIDLPGGGDFDAFCADGIGICTTTNECEAHTQVSGKINGQTTYQASQTLESDATIASTANIIYTAGQSITLHPGFHAESGSEFLARIADCEIQLLQDQTNDTYNRIKVIPNPSEVVALKIAPNPFNRQTQIDYYLPKGGFIHLSIRDITGQIVAPIVAEDKGEGWHQIQFNNTNLFSGIYYLSMYTENNIISKKIVILNN